LKNILSRHGQQVIPVIVMCAGIIVLLMVLWSYVKYSINIPWQDDYHTSLELIFDFKDASSITERSALLLQRHSSHILLSSNLVNILDWKLFGTLNFRHMVFVGFVLLCITVVQLQLQIRGENRGIHAVTVALLCINILIYASILWPLAALQNYPVLALTAAALLLLSKPGTARVCIAALLMTLATFSSGNGMLGFISGAAVLLATRPTKKLLLGWSAFSIFVVIIFFQIFENSKGFKIVRPDQDMGTQIIYFLTFLGSIVQFFPYSSRLAPLVGITLLAICILLLQQKYHHKNAVITGWILFMLLTAAAVTLGRCGNPYSGPFESRYAINSCVLVALIYVALMELYGKYIKRCHATAFCFMALLFNALTLHSYLPILAEQHENMIAGAQRYVTQADPAALASMYPDRAAIVLTEAARRNVYHIDAGLGIEPPYKIPPARIVGKSEADNHYTRYYGVD
jgi:hypothetical protein